MRRGEGASKLFEYLLRIGFGLKKVEIKFAEKKKGVTFAARFAEKRDGCESGKLIDMMKNK